MVINFLLPRPAKKPVGGYKVVFEYADRLSRRGHRINIVYNLRTPFTKPGFSLLRYLYDCFKLVPSWFRFNSSVNFKLVYQFSDKGIPDADVTIATWWETAYICKLLSSSKGRKYYLVQHYETWCGDKELVDGSYKLGLENIVISTWIKDMIYLIGGEIKAIIPNGINLDEFSVKQPINLRNPHSVAMMYHEAAWKGSQEGIKALETVKASLEDLRVTLFGVNKRPSWLPYWMDYECNPDIKRLQDIYNRAAVFFSTSWYEGFGLTGAESLACGCALVTTDSGGVREYAKGGKTALMCSPGNINEMAECLKKVLTDNELRSRLAEDGNKFIRRFDWDNAVDRFEKSISSK